MASQYTSEYPAGVQVDDEIKTFFEGFYLLSDTEEKHEEYTQRFTPDGTLVLGTKRVVGHDEILKFRKSMWEKVATRSHIPVKIFPFGDRADEVMLFGTVAYGLRDGKKAEVEWAARAQFATKGQTEGLKLKFYQVYLDSAAMANAK